MAVLMTVWQAKDPPHILLTDFDIAQDNSNQTTLGTSVPAGTPAYMSPESLEGKRPGEKHDIWSAVQSRFIHNTHYLM